MRPGTTNIEHTCRHGETISKWQTVDRGLYSGRSLHIERVTLYVVHTTGGNGEPPRSNGYYSQEEAEAVAEEYMGEPDGRGITQDWQPAE